MNVLRHDALSITLIRLADAREAVTATGAGHALQRLLARGCRHVVLDVSGLDPAPSGDGGGALLEALRGVALEVRRSGARLLLCGAPAAWRERLAALAASGDWVDGEAPTLIEDAAAAFAFAARARRAGGAAAGRPEAALRA